MHVVQKPLEESEDAEDGDVTFSTPCGEAGVFPANPFPAGGLRRTREGRPGKDARSSTASRAFIPSTAGKDAISVGEMCTRLLGERTFAAACMSEG